MKALVSALAVGWLALCAGCTVAAQAPAERELAIEATATVEVIDGDTRELTLRTEDGRLLTLVAGPDVRNFDQIEVGDTVRAVYVESVAVQMAAGDEARASDRMVVARAPAGAQPVGAIGRELDVTVDIVSYDPATAVATFTMPDGRTHSVVVDPAMRAFAGQLEPGDRVDIRYTSAVAIGVEAAER